MIIDLLPHDFFSWFFPFAIMLIFSKAFCIRLQIPILSAMVAFWIGVILVWFFFPLQDWLRELLYGFIALLLCFTCAFFFTISKYPHSIKNTLPVASINVWLSAAILGDFYTEYGSSYFDQRSIMQIAGLILSCVLIATLYSIDESQKNLMKAYTQAHSKLIFFLQVNAFLLLLYYIENS